MYNNILVAGSSGFVGSYLVDLLKKNNYKVFGLDIENVNILDKNKTLEYFKNKKIDCVVHLASLVSAKKSFLYPKKYMNNEINGTLNLLEICKQNNIKKFIYMSSISIHGSVDYEVDESSPLNPKHFYGASKIAGENIINIFAKISKIKTYIFRPNLIVGCDLNYPDLITIFIKEIITKKTYTIFGKGTHLRDWIHIFDIAMACKLAIDDKITNNETFCIGTNRYSPLDLGNMISKKISKGKPLFRKNNDHSFSLVCNSNKIKKYLKWKPIYTIDKIIDEKLKCT